MKHSVKTYKRKFDRELKHIKAILTRQRQSLPVNEWLDLVRDTKEAVLADPEEFLGPDLPERSVLCEAVDKTFEGFLEDQRLLANQTDKKFKIPLWIKSR